MSAGQPRSGWLPIHRHALFGVSALIGLAALVTALFLQAELAYSIGANAFFAAYSALVLAEMPLLSADYLSRNARATDQPLAVIFIITFMVVGVAVGALFQIINGQGVGPAGLVFALASIPLGWFTIHAMTALHYAHVYWSDEAGETTEKKPAGGFEFPGTKHRHDGPDFRHLCDDRTYAPHRAGAFHRFVLLQHGHRRGGSQSGRQPRRLKPRVTDQSAQAALVPGIGPRGV
jgi:uncharacterized membrane protein